MIKACNDITFETKVLKDGEKHTIEGTQIITVVSGEVKDRVKGVLKTFESSVYYSGEIVSTGDSLISIVSVNNPDMILDKLDIDKLYGDFCRKNWPQLRDLWDVEGFEKVDLYRSPQEELIFRGVIYKFNFWFCGKNVDCLWHNVHDFVETHTNIAGAGYMQKSTDGTDGGLVETVGLLPGNSHRTFNYVGEFDESGNPRYPFHRWLGGNNGNIWLVIEKY